MWKPLEETTFGEWDHTFAVNLRAAAYLCGGVLSDMAARRFGRIINIGSEAGVAIVASLAAYCVSKHALGALTEVIQNAHHDNGVGRRGDGVFVTVTLIGVSPGAVRRVLGTVTAAAGQGRAQVGPLISRSAG